MPIANFLVDLMPVKPQAVLKTSLFSLLAMFLALSVVEGLARVCERYLLHEEDAKIYRIPLKSQDVFRVFVYGGSTVVGHPVPEFGFVPQMIYGLEKGHHGRQIEIVNFGRSGASSTDVLDRLKATVYGKPDLIIVLTGHNEFLSPGVDGAIHSILAMLARNISAVRVMKYVLTTLLKKQAVSNESILLGSLPNYDRRSDVFLEKVKRYSSNLKKIVTVAKDSRIPLILGTLPSNMLDWPPVYHRIGKGQTYEEQVESVLASIENNHLSKARTDLNSFFDEMNISDPTIVYLEGLLSYRMGLFEGIPQKLKEAKDSDPLPWRVLSIFNELVRELEEKDRGIFAVDMERAFEGLSAGGVIGKALISDNCHPTPLGYSVMAIELINEMAHRLLPADVSVKLLPDTFLAGYLQTFTEGDTRKWWFRYFVTNAKYAMKPPFFNYLASMSFLEEASRIDACHLHVLLNKASLHLLMGEKIKGVQVLRAAKQIANNSINLDKTQHAPYLMETLTRSGVSLDDLPSDVVEGSECVG